MLSGYLFLGATICADLLFFALLKSSLGFAYKPYVFMAGALYLAKFFTTGFALKSLDMSYVYLVWSGAGSILIAIMGHYFFAEALSPWKLLCISLVVLGVIGIHLK